MDFYETPRELTRAALTRVPIAGRVLEPTAGDLAIVHELRANGLTVVTNDLVPTRPTDFHLDATDPRAWRRLVDEAGPFDWIVGNPPFGCAIDIMRLAREHAQIGVMMLLRLTFHEPTEALDPRAPFLIEHPPHQQLCGPRISYTGDGHTDSVPHAWLVWYRHPPMLERPFEYITMSELESLGYVRPDRQPRERQATTPGMFT